MIGGVDGQVIHFASDTVRSASRTAGPVRAIRIRGAKTEEEVEAVGAEGEEGEEEVEDDDAEAKPTEVRRCRLTLSNIR